MVICLCGLYGTNLHKIHLLYSRGTVRLVSPDPTAQPEIRPNYFTHPLDMKTMIAGIRFALRLGNSKYFKR